MRTHRLHFFRFISRMSNERHAAFTLSLNGFLFKVATLVFWALGIVEQRSRYEFSKFFSLLLFTGTPLHKQFTDFSIYPGYKANCLYPPPTGRRRYKITLPLFRSLLRSMIFTAKRVCWNDFRAIVETWRKEISAGYSLSIWLISSSTARFNWGSTFLAL